jgi:hypothetical protein
MKRIIAWSNGTVYQENHSSITSTNQSGEFNFYVRAYRQLGTVIEGKVGARLHQNRNSCQVSISDNMHVSLGTRVSKNGTTDLFACVEGCNRALRDAVNPIVVYDGWLGNDS